MTALEWDDSFSVGIRKVDLHNQYLFKLLSGLHNGLIKQSEARVIKSGFTELSDYLVYHFACEEIWMIHSNYSPTAEHYEEHKQLKLMLADVCNSFMKYNSSVEVKLSSLIKLFATHIKTSDICYGRYENDKVSKKTTTPRRQNKTAPNL